MNSEKFLETHRGTWEQLNNILEQMNKKGPVSLKQEDLVTLGPLFRRVTSHLAYAQANYQGHEMVDYLNRLVVKAHGHIYRTETLGIRKVWDFYRRGFPRLVAKQWQYIAAAGLLLLLGVFTGYLFHFFQPSLDGLIIPDQLQRTISQQLGQGKVGSEWPVNQRPVISTTIMTNNISVGFTSFALGFTWGIGTVLVLFFNGLMLGVLGGFFTTSGFTLDFWALILPHGILELTAIFICGGAGLVLAKALAKPGDYRRRDALVQQGKTALTLVLGSLPLFVIAALIEGFITPAAFSNHFKLGFAAMTLVALIIYLAQGFLGRKVSEGDFS